VLGGGAKKRIPQKQSSALSGKVIVLKVEKGGKYLLVGEIAEGNEPAEEKTSYSLLKKSPGYSQKKTLIFRGMDLSERCGCCVGILTGQCN